MDFAHSARTRELLERLIAFQEREVGPREEHYHRELLSRKDPWVVLPAIEELKAKARQGELWNLFLPMSSMAPAFQTSSTPRLPSAWAAR